MTKYYFEDKMTAKIKKQCDFLIRAIPDLHYIDKKDFDVLICLDRAPIQRGSGKKVIAEMEHVTHWLADVVEMIRGKPLPNYMMIVYPIYYSQTFEERIKTLIHELFHINENKTAIRPHVGFGDEAIVLMYRKNLAKLRRGA